MQFIFYFLSSTPFFLSDKSPPIYSSAQVDIIISIQPKSRVYTHTHTCIFVDNVERDESRMYPQGDTGKLRRTVS